MKCNLNDYVYVKLNEYGKSLFSSHWARYNVKLALNVDEDGRIRFQLWELMQIYGPFMFQGQTHYPFETMEIEIEKAV